MGFFFSAPFWTTSPSNLCQLSPSSLSALRRETGWGRGCLTVHYVALHFNSHFQNGISSLPSLITVKLRPQVQISLFQFLEMVNVQGVSGEMWQHLTAPLTDFFQPTLPSGLFSQLPCPPTPPSEVICSLVLLSLYSGLI